MFIDLGGDEAVAAVMVEIADDIAARKVQHHQDIDHVRLVQPNQIVVKKYRHHVHVQIQRVMVRKEIKMMITLVHMHQVVMNEIIEMMTVMMIIIMVRIKKHRMIKIVNNIQPMPIPNHHVHMPYFRLHYNVKIFPMIKEWLFRFRK